MAAFVILNANVHEFCDRAHAPRAQRSLTNTHRSGAEPAAVHSLRARGFTLTNASATLIESIPLVMAVGRWLCPRIPCAVALTGYSFVLSLSFSTFPGDHTWRTLPPHFFTIRANANRNWVVFARATKWERWQITVHSEHVRRHTHQTPTSRRLKFGEKAALRTNVGKLYQQFEQARRSRSAHCIRSFNRRSIAVNSSSNNDDGGGGDGDDYDVSTWCACVCT